MINYFSALGTEAIFGILKQSGDATAIYTGQDLTIQFVNDAMLKIWGKDDSIKGSRFNDALPEMKGQLSTQLLKDVWTTGKVYEATNTPVILEIDGKMITSYFDFIYRPIIDVNGKIYCILHTATDVTEKVKAWELVREKEAREQRINEELAASNEEYRATNEELNETNALLTKTFQKLELTEGRIQELIRTTPVGLALLHGPEMIIETANPGMLEILGESEDGVQGRPLLDVFPLLKGQVFSDQLDLVFESGKAVNFESVPFRSYLDGKVDDKYIDINFLPLLNFKCRVDAVMATAVNVTENVNSRKALQASERRAQEYSEELMALNQEIQSANEESSSTNEYLEKANQKIDLLNEQLRKDNVQLSYENTGFQDSISDLNNYNKDLELRNIELKELNDTITKLNGKLYDSEVSFSNIVSQSPVAMMLVKGDDFIVSMINSSMLELLGKDEGIIGKPLLEEIPELKGQHAANLLIGTYEKGKFNYDLSNPVTLNRNGNLEKGFFNFSYTPYIEDGQVTGVIDIAVEVTSQVLAIQEKERTIIENGELEKTIRNSEQRLHSILETMAEGVGVIDAEGQLVYANPMAQQILGLSESTIKDRKYDDPQWQNLRLDGSPLPSEEHPMSIMMKTQKPVFDHEIGVQPMDRDRMFISINAAPLFDDDGNLSGGIGTFMDVTTRRMISQGKDDFISIASHELKTPVTSLKATLQLLQRSSDRLTDETRNRLLDQSVNSLDKLTRLINDLLDTSRLEQGQLKVEKSSFPIAELFDDCCSSLTHPSGKKIFFEGETDVIVEADNMQIGQVMANFITNAIKYAPDSDIRINAQKTDSEMMVSVQDSGPGIPKDKLTHLFDRYYRTDYRGQKFTGLGLGLYISSDIIKNHGGKIGVESELGSGTKFWFTLPL